MTATRDITCPDCGLDPHTPECRFHWTGSSPTAFIPIKSRYPLPPVDWEAIMADTIVAPPTLAQALRAKQESREATRRIVDGWVILACGVFLGAALSNVIGWLT